MTIFHKIFFNTTDDRLYLIWRILLLVVLSILLILIGDLLVVKSLSTLLDQEITPEPTTITGLITLLNTPIALGLATLIAMRVLDKRPFNRYGLRFNSQWVLEFAIGAVLGGLIAGGIIAIQLMAGWIKLTGTLHAGELGRFSPLILSAIVLHVVTAAGEELLFRGYLIPNIGEAISKRIHNLRRSLWISLAVVSILFGLVHILNSDGSLTYAVNIILSGSIVLGVGYLITGSIALPFGLHALYNLCQQNIFALDETTPALLRFTQQSGPTILTGGELGFDGSLLTIFMALTATLLILLWGRYRYGKIAIHDSLIDGR